MLYLFLSSVPGDEVEDFDMSFKYGGDYDKLPNKDKNATGYEALVKDIEELVSTLKLPLRHFLNHQIDISFAPKLSCSTAWRTIAVNVACPNINDTWKGRKSDSVIKASHSAFSLSWLFEMHGNAAAVYSYQYAYYMHEYHLRILSSLHCFIEVCTSIK